MSSFKTTNGITFTVDIKTKDMRAVKELVKYPDGKPVDIMEAAETGTLAGIVGNLALMVDTMFVLCLDQVKQYFDLKKYDEENRATYELFPDQKDEPALTKASRWFGSIIDGDALSGVIAAFSEAVVNFTPNENRRKTLLAILDKERETERLEAEYQLATVNRMFDQAKTGLERRWNQMEKRELLNLETTLDGQFGFSGSVPESSASIPLASRSEN